MSTTLRIATLGVQTPIVAISIATLGLIGDVCPQPTPAARTSRGSRTSIGSSTGAPQIITKESTRTAGDQELIKLLEERSTCNLAVVPKGTLCVEAEFEPEPEVFTRTIRSELAMSIATPAEKPTASPVVEAVVAAKTSDDFFAVMKSNVSEVLVDLENRFADMLTTHAELEACYAVTGSYLETHATQVESGWTVLDQSNYDNFVGTIQMTLSCLHEALEGKRHIVWDATNGKVIVTGDASEEGYCTVTSEDGKTTCKAVIDVDTAKVVVDTCVKYEKLVASKLASRLDQYDVAMIMSGSSVEDVNSARQAAVVEIRNMVRPKQSSKNLSALEIAMYVALTVGAGYLLMHALTDTDKK